MTIFKKIVSYFLSYYIDQKRAIVFTLQVILKKKRDIEEFLNMIKK